MHSPTIEDSARTAVAPNGAAVAACLAAGIGAFTVGLVVILNEIGLVTVPAFYAPAGGVSGRTTIAVVIWFVAWGVLHLRWQHRWIEPRRVQWVALALIVVGLVLTFPPVWRML